MKHLSKLVVLAAMAVVMPTVGAQSWQPLNRRAPVAMGVPLLLTDGTVLVHRPSTSEWYRLRPSNTGSYVDGTWSKAGSMPSNYGPLYFASAVLRDGRVVVSGGEYNFGQGVWTNLGAIYNPASNTWAPLAGPPGWGNIGDTQCTVMRDGKLLMARLTNTDMSILDPATLTWTNFTPPGKRGRFNEEGWTLMPEGTILTVNCSSAPTCDKYVPWLQRWVDAGSTPQIMVDAGSLEMGPHVLMANGKVFAMGATGHNAVYTPGANPTDTGTWTAAPDFPLSNNAQLEMADAPACLLPNGHVLCGASPGVFVSPTEFFEYDGTNLVPVPATPNSPNNPCFVGNMLMLPTGQVMYTDFSDDVQIYTPAGGPQNSWRPSITSVPSTLLKGLSFTLQGLQLNGMSECSMYGDDSSNATNYPLMRLKNVATGHVYFAKTFNHSVMAVATGSLPVSTNFTVPSNMESGVATLEVVTNGIASAPKIVTIIAFTGQVSAVSKFEGASATGGLNQVLASDNTYFSVKSSFQNQTGQVASTAVTFTLNTGTPADLNFTFESSAASYVSALYFIFDWSANKWVYVGATPQSAVDKISTFKVASPTSRYVNGQKQVKILLRAIMPVNSSHSPVPFVFRLDSVQLSG